MALEVETGSGSAASESYASVADADAYQAARGRSLWATLSTTEKEQALRRGTDWMMQEYRGRWKGTRASSAQALDWPRYDVCVDDYLIASNAVPAEVNRACIEMAFRAASGDLLADQAAQVKSVTVGPITKVYADGARQNKRYAAVDNMLRSLLQAGGGIKVVRA